MLSIKGQKTKYTILESAQAYYACKVNKKIKTNKKKKKKSRKKKKDKRKYLPYLTLKKCEVPK